MPALALEPALFWIQPLGITRIMRSTRTDLPLPFSDAMTRMNVAPLVYGSKAWR